MGEGVVSRDSGGQVTLLRRVGVVLKVKQGVLAEGRRCVCVRVRVVLCWTWSWCVGMWEAFGSSGMEQQQQRRWDGAFKSILFTIFLPLWSFPLMFALFFDFCVLLRSRETVLTNGWNSGIEAQLPASSGGS